MCGYLSNLFFSALLAISPGFVLAAETRDGLQEKGATMDTSKYVTEPLRVKDKIHPSVFSLSVEKTGESRYLLFNEYCGTISAIGLNKILQYRMICLIECLDQVGMLFLSDLSRQKCTKYTGQQGFDVPDSPTGHGAEKKDFRRQQTQMETGHQRCRTRVRTAFRVRGSDKILPECAEYRTSLSARITRRHVTWLEQTRMCAEKASTTQHVK